MKYLQIFIKFLSINTESIKKMITMPRFLLWSGLFFFAAFIGMLTYEYLLEYLIQLFKSSGGNISHLEKASNIPIIGKVFFIFAANLLTVSVVVVLGRLFWGIYPVTIVAINGYIVGFAGMLLSLDPEFNLINYFTVIIPHGIIEIPALLIAAIIGISTGIKLKDKFKLLSVPATMLFCAAFIEVFISTKLL